MVNFRRLILIIFILLALLDLSFAQEGAQPYFEEQEEIVKLEPPIGTMFLYGGKFVFQYFDEPTRSAEGEVRAYPYIYYGYESLGIYVQPMVRYYKQELYEIQSEEENIGYDDTLIPNIQSKGRIYLFNYFILQRNLQYFFGDFLQTARIGKLWIDYSPYTMYRTFGPEGISLGGKILPVKYEMFYSYNTTAGSNMKTSVYETNSRNMIGSRFLFDQPGYFLLELIGVYYNAASLRNEKAASIKIGKSGIFDIIYIELLNAERYHTEGDAGHGFWGILFHKDAIEENKPWTKYFYGRFSRILTSLNLKLAYLTLSYTETTANFLPYDDFTWMRYEPLQATGDWIYEEERAISVNEKSYNLQLAYTLAGIKLQNSFEWGTYLDPDIKKPWMIASPPGLLIELSAEYLVGWVTITHRLYQKTAGPEKFQNFINELWIPITETDSLAVIPRIEYFRKYRSDSTVTDKIVEFLRIEYIMGNKELILEMNYSDIDQDEPDWLIDDVYYSDQSWGIDNFVRLRFEYNF